MYCLATANYITIHLISFLKLIILRVKGVDFTILSFLGLTTQHQRPKGVESKPLRHSVISKTRDLAQGCCDG